MIPIVSVVGRSNSGKTTLLEKLIRELTARGHCIGTVKHDVHGFDVDREGKDSWRHKEAGAHTVVLSSPKRLALIRDVQSDQSLEEIRGRFIRDVDLILSEGYKSDVHPKIEVYRKAAHPEPLCTHTDALVAVASDTPLDLGAPCLDIDDVRGLADLVEERFLRRRKERSVWLMVNGRRIALSPFAHQILLSTVQGLLGALKGCKNAERIELRVE
ncbi:MAG: molybdopterin-guanine dinucleotide biosynthesis protein B [Deltaproteobacteria bacterium]|nr:molybdopterin-guanine dinucleotide biosynthesis protein B [Deltaproteobacteria bacterium]MBW2305360.1 molybdopterin-guanine dinucleotide biosynthesis protein B [Deltaproteobacteria bacterium]